MNISIILPQFLSILIDDKQEKNTFNDCVIKLNARSALDLFIVFSQHYPQIVHKIFMDNGTPHKNIILVLNDKIINKSALSETVFKQDSVLEIMFQFAGG